MPRIADAVQECVVYLYRDKADANAGAKSGGSGFLVGVPFKQLENRIFIYAVTNTHVVKNPGNAPVIRINTRDGKHDVIQLTAQHWVDHPANDVSVALVQPNANVFQFKCVGLRDFVDQALIDTLKLGGGDETFMVGRFINHEGKQRNLPSIRFGNISMMPWEPIEHPFGHQQESFVVEMRSLAGFSGSPVFVYIPPFDNREGIDTQTSAMQGPWLLGIDWGHINWKEPVRDKAGNPVPDGLHVRANSGANGVVPAWRIRELLDSDPVAKVRDDIEAQLIEQERSKQSGVTLDGLM